MPKQNFLLVSLEEKQAEQLAQVLANPTSRKIIDYLSENKEATETEISKKFGVPLSTVHYNLQKLKGAKLVEIEEFHYSKKGREIDHYRLANKYVIITPKPVKGIRSALRSVLPAGLVVLGISALIRFLQKVPSQEQIFQTEEPKMMIAQLAQDAAAKSEPNIALWFMLGGLASLVFVIMIQYIRNRWR